MKIKTIFLFIFSLFLLLPVFAEEPEILRSETGLVESVQYADEDENIGQVKQIVDVKLLSGEFKGQKIELENILTGNPYYDIKLKKGTKVLLHAENNGNGIEYSIEDIKRAGTLVWLSLLFCGLLIYIGIFLQNFRDFKKIVTKVYN